MPILIDNFDLLWRAVNKFKEDSPFEILAWVVLPDHFHWVINAGKNNPSLLVRRIKLSFSLSYRKRYGWRQGRVWQYRFWNHQILSQKDLNNHIDYIHRNPVKHGLAKEPFGYKYSSFSDFYKEGYYSRDWSVVEDSDKDFEFGE
jgi:putative transposase